MAVRWQLLPSTNYSELNIRYTIEAKQYYERFSANFVEYISENEIKNNGFHSTCQSISFAFIQLKQK